MLWLRGLVFTALVPLIVAGIVPLRFDPGRTIRTGWWQLGWAPVAAGALIYTLCLLRFLAAGGTPAIFFLRPLRAVVGEEPRELVAAGLYRFSRNPMYVGVLLVVFGQAILFASWRIAVYAGALGACFHLVVVLVEEPHLRAARGAAYERYCGDVSRWVGRRRHDRGGARKLP